MGSAEDFWLGALVLEWKMGVPPIVEALEDAGMGTIVEYIARGHNSVVHYIATQPVF